MAQQRSRIGHATRKSPMGEKRSTRNLGVIGLSGRVAFLAVREVIFSDQVGVLGQLKKTRALDITIIYKIATS